MANNDNKQQQVDIAERIQNKLLERWETLIVRGEISAAEVAVVTKFLKESGWTVDPSLIPKGLEGVLTRIVDPSKFNDGDDDVVGRIA